MTGMHATSEATQVRTLPATPAQRRLVLAASLRPQDSATNISMVCRLPAGTDPHRIARAVRRVFEADNSLNEVFGMAADGSIVATLMRGAATCPVSASASVEQLRSSVQQVADSPIDIGQWPLYHVEIAIVGDDFYFVFVGSHLVTDAFGFFQLISDIDATYRDPAHQPGYTKSPSENGHEVGRDNASEYFADVFAGLDSLAIDGWGGRDEHGRIRGTITRHDSPRDAYRMAGDLATRLRMRRYSVLVTVYGLLVAVLARQSKVTVSNPMSNRRMGGEAAKTRGLMTNALPVMIDTTRFTTFAALCADVDRQIGVLIEYEGCAFADIARDLLRDLHVDATVPSASFTLYPQPIAPVLNGEPAVPELVDRRFLQYPLSLNIEVSGGYVTLIVERADGVPDVDVPGVFWGIVRQVAGDPDVPLTAIAWG